MPHNSTSDAWTICESIRKFDAFPHVRSLSARQKLQVRVLSCERIVTLKSFHRDTILLEGCYQPLRSLFQVRETTLRGECEALFRHDARYFPANYTDLWLYIMRNYPWLSNHSSASLKKDGYGDEPVHHPKSNAEVSKLASFAASRGFCNSNIDNLLRGHHFQIHSEPVGTEFPKLSYPQANIPRHNRCSLPRAGDFEQAWNYLSLQNVFQIQTQFSQKHSTAFAVVRDIVRCFWGTVTPREIDNPRRTLQAHQYMELHNDLDGTGDESQDSSCENVAAVDSNSMQGISQDPANLPRPTSSMYSGSGRTPSPPTSPRYGSAVNEEVWGEEEIVEPYRRQIDVASTGSGTAGHAVESGADSGTSQAKTANGDTLMLPSSDFRSIPSASTNIEDPIFSLQSVENEPRGERVKPDKAPVRTERVDETLHETKKAGRRGNPHRIEKPQHYTEKKKLKQQQAQLTKALRDHDDQLRPAVSQTGHVDVIDTERKEMEDMSDEVEPHHAQSHGRTGQSEVLCIDREPFSGDQLPHGEASVTSRSKSATPQLEDEETIVKNHLSDVEQDMQRGSTQWYGNDGDDDVQTANRKAEEQMRGADDAVGEVHDNIPAVQSQQSRGNEIDVAVNSDDVIHIPRNATSDMFPGGSMEPATDSNVGRHEPIQIVAAPNFNEGQVETSEENTSRQDKRRPTYHDMGYVDPSGNSVMPRIPATASLAEEPGTATVSGDAGLTTGRPQSMFPGRSLVPDNGKQVTPEEHSSSQVTAFSKKRNNPTESEDADVHLRSPRNTTQAQLNSWEPFKETVDSIRRLWSVLDHTRIYVTSPLEVEELSAQQVPDHRRLWSWLKEDQELFNQQISSLLTKKFGFQVVCSDTHSRRRQYCSLEHMDYWNAYFGDNEPGYWLAILTPWRAAGSSRDKVRKTHNVEESRT